jgi:hypothetical protein
MKKTFKQHSKRSWTTKRHAISIRLDPLLHKNISKISESRKLSLNKTIEFLLSYSVTNYGSL